MKKAIVSASLCLAVGFAAATFVSCKDKETTVEETTVETTTEEIPLDTTQAEPVTPADTTATMSNGGTPVQAQ
ncbi:hypothetical protein [Flavobacterium sp.]|uniref:hypothetical protein n=1 Tax=Flavobacterium sp. TaxID=239 RepID=UPI0039E4E7B5